MKAAIRFLEFGGGEKSLIFLAGWNQSKKSFLGLVPFLFKNYKIYLLDLPGFGEAPFSPKLKDSFAYANYLYAWLKRKKISKPVLIGHSFGGKVAALVAGIKPQILKGLVLISPSGIPHPKFYYPLLPFLKKIPFISWLKPLFLSRDYQEAGNLLPLFKKIVKEDIRENLTKIEIPTLIIWGENDDELPLKDAYQMRSLIKNSFLKIIKNSGHFPFIDNPKKISFVIESFVKKLWKS